MALSLIRILGTKRHNTDHLPSLPVVHLKTTFYSTALGIRSSNLTKPKRVVLVPGNTEFFVTRDEQAESEITILS